MDGLERLEGELRTADLTALALAAFESRRVVAVRDLDLTTEHLGRGRRHDNEMAARTPSTYS